MVISAWDLILAAAALAYLATGAVLALYEMYRPAAWHGPVVWVMAAHAVGVNGLLLVLRSYPAGAEGAFRHSFDSVVLFATLVAVLALVSRAVPAIRGLHPLLLPVAAVLQAACFLTVHQPGVGFQYKPWFVTHMASLILGATSFAAGGVAGMAYLLVHRRLRAWQPAAWLGHLPPLETLEQFGRRMMVIGFALLTFGILTGICGIAHTGQWTRFLKDPLVISTVLMWVFYAAALLGIRLRPALRGPRAAWLAVWSFVLLICGFIVADLFSPTH